jgi:hypothetical protein
MDVYDRLMQDAKAPVSNASATKTEEKNKEDTVKATVKDTSKSTDASDSTVSSKTNKTSEPAKKPAMAQSAIAVEKAHQELKSLYESESNSIVSYAQTAAEASSSQEARSKSDPFAVQKEAHRQNVAYNRKLHGVRGMAALKKQEELLRTNTLLTTYDYLSKFYVEMFPKKGGKRVHSVLAPADNGWKLAWVGSKDKKTQSIYELEKKFGVEFKHEYFENRKFEVFVEPNNWAEFFRRCNTAPFTKKLVKAVDLLNFWLFVNEEGARKKTALVFPYNCWEMLRDETNPLVAAFKNSSKAPKTKSEVTDDSDPSKREFVTRDVVGPDDKLRRYRDYLPVGTDTGTVFDRNFDLTNVQHELESIDGVLQGRFAEEAEEEARRLAEAEEQFKVPAIGRWSDLTDDEEESSGKGKGKEKATTVLEEASTSGKTDDAKPTEGADATDKVSPQDPQVRQDVKEDVKEDVKPKEEPETTRKVEEAVELSSETTVTTEEAETKIASTNSALQTFVYRPMPKPVEPKRRLSA